ncbi:MAG: DUF2062 domain-containing protein [Gammaproteobacteria bacterium]
MPRRLLKRYLPDRNTLRGYKSLDFLGERLYDPNLWHFNRRSVSGAFGVGMFIAFIPAPGQMLMAALASLWLRINLPLTVSLNWITNPITMAPLIYLNFKVGFWVLGREPFQFHFSPSIDWMIYMYHNFFTLGLPFLVGSLTVGLALGVLSFFAVRLFWRFFIVYRLYQRRKLAAHRAARG